MTKEKSSDGILKELSQQRMSDIPEPNFDQMWESIENKLDEGEDERRSPFPLRMIACVLIVIFATAALLNPIQARALGERVVTTIKSIVSGSLVNESIGFSPKDEQSPDRPGNVQNNTSRTINEIVSQASFDVQVPGYLPTDYELKDAQVSAITSKLSKVTLKYSNGTDILIITENNAPDDYGQSILYDNEDMLREEIKIDSQDYIVLTHKSGWTEIVWSNKGILFKIESKLPKEQALKVASGFEEAGK